MTAAGGRTASPDIAMREGVPFGDRPVGERRVRPLMRQRGLLAKPPVRKVKTTDSGHDLPRFPQLLWSGRFGWRRTKSTTPTRACSTRPPITSSASWRRVSRSR